MSSIVAVAGGTGDLGRTIVEAILSNTTYKVFILARQASEEKERKLGAPILVVDYNNVDGIKEVLEQNKVDTLISTIGFMGGLQPELNLIKAADQAASTKRYIPSVWGIKYTKEFASSFPLAGDKLAVVEALGNTSLEYTAWYIGYFADYFLSPAVKSYMKTISIVVDVANNTAAIPGSGNVPVVFTYSVDVARFVAASLSLQHWDPETWLIGDSLTLNELTALAEEVKGVKFDVTYDSIETLKSGKITELPSHREVYVFMPKEQLQGIFSVFGIMFESGLLDLKPDRTIDEDLSGEKPRKLRDLLTEAWQGN